MGTCTFAQQGTAGQTAVDDYFGMRRVKFGAITMSSSYATGGDTILISAFGMEFIDWLDFGMAVPAGGATGIFLSMGQSTLAPQDPATATIKIQAYWVGPATSGVFAEVTAAQNLSTFVGSVVVYGA
jgi:hypothetical protein